MPNFYGFLFITIEHRIRTLDQETPIKCIEKETIVEQESINHFRPDLILRKYGPARNRSRYTTVDGTSCSYNGLIINCWLRVVESGKNKQIHFLDAFFPADDDDVLGAVFSFLL